MPADPGGVTIGSGPGPRSVVGAAQPPDEDPSPRRSPIRTAGELKAELYAKDSFEILEALVRGDPLRLSDRWRKWLQDDARRLDPEVLARRSLAHVANGASELQDGEDLDRWLLSRSEPALWAVMLEESTAARMGEPLAEPLEPRYRYLAVSLGLDPSEDLHPLGSQRLADGIKVKRKACKHMRPIPEDFRERLADIVNPGARALIDAIAGLPGVPVPESVMSVKANSNRAILAPSNLRVLCGVTLRPFDPYPSRYLMGRIHLPVAIFCLLGPGAVLCHPPAP